MQADAFRCIADALSRTIAERGLQDASHDDSAWDASLRNLILDACGSDHRPLVDLVLGVGATVRPQLRALARDGTPMTPARWERDRAPLVHAIVSTRYLQPEVSRWVVDAWGVALGIAPDVVLQPPSIAQVEPARTAIVANAAWAGNTPPARAAAGRMPVASTRAGGASHRATFHAAPVVTRQRIGSKWASGPRAATPPDPRLAARVRRIEKSAVVALALLVSGVMALLTFALDRPRTAPEMSAPRMPAPAVPSIGSPVTGTALPMTEPFLVPGPTTLAP